MRGRAHSDALPVRGRSKVLYQIVFFHEDANFIHIEVSKSRKGTDLLAALQRAVKFLLIVVRLRLLFVWTMNAHKTLRVGLHQHPRN